MQDVVIFVCCIILFMTTNCNVGISKTDIYFLESRNWCEIMESAINDPRGQIFQNIIDFDESQLYTIHEITSEIDKMFKLEEIMVIVKSNFDTLFIVGIDYKYFYSDSLNLRISFCFEGENYIKIDENDKLCFDNPNTTKCLKTLNYYKGIANNIQDFKMYQFLTDKHLLPLPVPEADSDNK